MNKWTRIDFDGERTKNNLAPELKRHLESYAPATMMSNEIEDFQETIHAIKKDFEEIEKGLFEKVFHELNEIFCDRNNNYVAPTL